VPKLLLPPVKTHLREVFLSAEILNALLTPIRLPQEANLLFRVSGR